MDRQPRYGVGDLLYVVVTEKYSNRNAYTVLIEEIAKVEFDYYCQGVLM